MFLGKPFSIHSNSGRVRGIAKKNLGGGHTAITPPKKSGTPCFGKKFENCSLKEKKNRKCET